MDFFFAGNQVWKEGLQRPLLQCKYGHLSIVLRQDVENVNSCEQVDMEINVERDYHSRG